MRARSVLAFAVWLTLLLTGCQQTTTPTAVPPTATMLPTRIAADTAVAATIPTVTPSPAPSITPSPTHLLTPASSP
ncbi:MAG TPA: hypothetical protein PLK31_13105, partial [Chloroflexota bacterium]|nr:hypothetical protein [Chloroflexota bacterium]